MKRSGNQPDMWLLFMPVVIFFIGLFFIYSASWREGQPLDQSLVIKQSLWMVLAVGVLLVSLRFHYRYLLMSVWWMYAAVIVLLIVVLYTPARLGAHRWIHLGWFNLQPSELAKFVMIVALAFVMKERHFGQGNPSQFLIPLAVVALPMLLILKEPDLGTGLLFIPVLLSLMMMSGFKIKWVVIMITGALLLSPFLYHQLKGYQKLRLLTFLDPDRDPLGAGYTIIQSKIAIGSGGLFGKGLLAGSQTQLHFLPERHTDFIFSVIAEEGGFIAAVVVIIAYWVIVQRGYSIAHHCTNRFGKLLATGITTLLATQALVNMGMTMGLLPVVGMPLFFASYGGSSIMVSLFLIGILMNIDMRRDPFI